MTTRPTSRQQPLKSLPPGEQVAGRYVIDRVLGDGASGIVYAAHDQETSAQVALKIIHPHLLSDRQIFGRFRREAAILRQLQGDNLVKILDYIEDDARLIIVLEYVDGVPLDALLERSDRISLTDATEIMLQVCSALGLAHGSGIVHRDLKPSNVLVIPATSERPLEVRVVDFGLAKMVHGDAMTTGLTEQDMIFGTPEYMAPEQVRGEDVDARADLYAAGIMLYELAVGVVPFQGKTPIATMTAHLAERPKPPRLAAPDRGISPTLQAVILRAIAQDPSDRYPTARELAEALASAEHDPLVITALGTTHDREDIAIRDTDLHVDSAAALALPPAVAASRAASEPPVSDELAHSSWLWVVVAVITTMTAVGVGLWAGLR